MQRIWTDIRVLPLKQSELCCLRLTKQLMTTAVFVNYCMSRFPQALEIMENLENHEKKVPRIAKSWNLKKTLNNHGKFIEFCEII